MEEQFRKGFNAGYIIAKFQPELFEKIKDRIEPTDNHYIDGFLSGKREYDLEKNSIYLDDIKKLRSKSRGEHERDKDIDLER